MLAVQQSGGAAVRTCGCSSVRECGAAAVREPTAESDGDVGGPDGAKGGGRRRPQCWRSQLSSDAVVPASEVEKVTVVLEMYAKKRVHQLYPSHP